MSDFKNTYTTEDKKAADLLKPKEDQTEQSKVVIPIETYAIGDAIGELIVTIKTCTERIRRAQ